MSYIKHWEKGEQKTKGSNDASITHKYDQKSVLSFSQLNVWHPNWPFQIFPGGHVSPGCFSLWGEKNCPSEDDFQRARPSICKCTAINTVPDYGLRAEMWVLLRQRANASTFRPRKNVHNWAEANYAVTITTTDVFCSEGGLTFHRGPNRKRSRLSVQPLQSDERE